jgi:hypothetical protein
MRIGDNFAFHIRPPFPDPACAGRQAIVGTYFLTPEARSVCLEILPRLSGFPTRQPGALILSGHPGVGKTHLLRYLMALLENPEDAAWNALLLPESPRPASALSSLYLPVPDDPSQDLAAALLHAARNRGTPATDRQVRLMPCYLQWEPSDLAARLAKSAVTTLAQPLALVVLDNVSRRLRRIADPSQLQREYGLTDALVDSLSEKGILVVIVGEEGDLKREIPDTGGERKAGQNRLAWEVVRLRRTNVAQVIAGALASKDTQQRARILKVLNGLREKLPSLGPSLETMADLYPIHPYVFQALFELRSVFPDFAVLQFVQIGIKASRTRPADRLVTIDWLLDYIVSDLQKREEYRPLVAAYEEFQRTVIPQLKPQIQQKALELLKAITLLAVCDLKPPTVTNLADALLIYDQSDLLPSYALTSAILAEMELHGSRYLGAEGTLRERRYFLVQDAPPLQDREPFEPEEFRLRVPLMLYDWFQSQFGSWNPDMTAKYQRTSQSLTATAKAVNGTATGLVHFKSFFDPLWTDADLAALHEAAAEWILLVLSPFERFYELDAAVRELAAQSPRLLIWRPDSPTPEESEQLQELASLKLFTGDVDSCRDQALIHARNTIREIFAHLYIKRGKLISRTGQCYVKDRIDHQTAEEFLSSCLVSLISPSGSHPEVSPDRLQPEDATKRDEMRHALEWAALLSGSDGIRKLSLDRARTQLIEWWAAHVGLDSTSLSASCAALPDSFLTTGFSGEVKFFTKTLKNLELLLQRLNRGEVTTAGAMTQIAVPFNRDRTQLLRWKRMLDGLPGLLRWTPSFEHARSYLNGACPSTQADLEVLRNELLASIAEPLRFLEASARDGFDRSFLAFKRAYTDYYGSLHNKILRLAEEPGDQEPGVDSVALRNLEMLSGLVYTNKSYLNRVRIIGRWIQANQCNLPVRQIVDRVPRCYCNFNPIETRYLAGLVSQINAVVTDGIEYFRTVLRSCKSLIIQELKNLCVDDDHSKQIAALLSHGTMVPLKPRSIEILNQVIQRHSSDFISEIRRHA